ncbi:MAG: restriction endonuclease subunit S [Methanosarcinaceae archaeon]|nr:restriction endonuclease subunit S [Methanosarcinaceae archaeon]
MKQEIKERVEKIRKGEVPDGYKETKVGIIPDDWNILELNKHTTKISDGIHTTPKYVEKSEYFFINGNNLKNGKVVITANTKCVSGDEFKKHKRELNSNTILMSINGTIGECAFYNHEKVILGKSAAYVNCINKEDVLFIYYNLQSSRSINHYYSELTGSTIKNLSLKSLKDTPIPSPYPKERQKIAEILSTWDKAIELKEKLIEEKKEFKRGLIQKLLVGKIRFKEYVKNPNLQEVRRYSTLPEDWSIKKASSIFSNISTKNNDNEKLLSATQDNGVIPRDMLDGDVMSPSGDTNSYKLVEEGDFVISLRTFQGGIEYSCYRGIISPAYTVIKNKIPICADFYRYIFKSKLFIDRLASSVIGIRDGKQISYGDFSFMFLPYPELKEQEKIAFSLKNLDDNIELLELELNHLKEQKRGLMQLLLTGIVRVEVD